jgi:hypothetical protein
MPTCRECHGTGQVEIKTEITTRCPDCHGTKQLPDGADCKRCNQWGEIGVGKFKVDKKLCRTCMGSGKVSEGSLTFWFLVRVVPATLLLLIAGGPLMWASWAFVGAAWLTTLLTVIFFGVWGGAMVYFVSQMPGLGEISATVWFLIRATPTTLVALAAGGAIIWSAWVYSQNLAIPALVALVVIAVWGGLMAYFILNLPE